MPTRTLIHDPAKNAATTTDQGGTNNNWASPSNDSNQTEKHYETTGESTPCDYNTQPDEIKDVVSECTKMESSAIPLADVPSQVPSKKNDDKQSTSKDSMYYSKNIDTAYRKCLNHQVFELLSMVPTISATTTKKKFSGVHFHINSVDRKTYKVSLFTNKLWDIILLKMTELVPFCTGKKRFQWDKYKPWDIHLSIQTIAECLGVSDSIDSLVHLHDRVVEAATVLKNISIRIQDRQIDGYLDYVGIRDKSDTDDYYLRKSNSMFHFGINPALIDYINSERPGLYHFNHSWLHIPEHQQNAYAAAKRLGRHYSQNTHKRMIPSDFSGVRLEIGVLRKSMPRLNNKIEKDNRAALDKALRAIPGIRFAYLPKNSREILSFEELRKLRWHKTKYDKVQIVFDYYAHPNTSDCKVTKDLIRCMQDDARYIDLPSYRIEDAKCLIDHRGILIGRPYECEATRNNVAEHSHEPD